MPGQSYYGAAKPPPGAALDFGHPLAQGMVGCWPMNEGAGQLLNNLAGFGRLPPAILQSPAIWAGDGIASNGAAYSVTTTAPGSTVSGAFTVLVRTRPAVTGGTIIFSTRQGGEFSFDMQFDVPGLHGDVGSGGGWINTSLNATLTIVAGTLYDVCYVVTPTTFSIYLNAALVGSGSHGPATPLLWDSGHSLGLVGTNGQTKHVYVWNRPLGATEVARLYARPYAMFAPPVWRRYFVVAPSVVVQPTFTRPIWLPAGRG